MQPTSREVYYITNYERQKCYVSAYFRCLLTTFVLIRNILIAFTTSCVSIFDISNDILYTSSFSHHSFTSSTANNADFRFIQILHVPLYFIGQKFSHEQIQHGLLFTKRIAWFVESATSTLYFPTFWNLFSVFKKNLPFLLFLWSVLEQDRRFELPPSVWKTDVLTVNTNLAYKGGEPSSPRAIFNVVFWRDGFTTNSPLVFTAAFTQVTREGLLGFHIYIRRKKRMICP